MTELDRILLNSMPNSWSNQAYVQVFDCESITFKGFLDMFEHMEIAESILIKTLLVHIPPVLVTTG